MTTHFLDDMAEPCREQIAPSHFTLFLKRYLMKVIKSFGNDDTCYTLPPYDGSHYGNICAWIEAIHNMRLKDPQLHDSLLKKITEFRENKSNEIEILSTLFRQDIKYDVRVIWRRQKVTLHMYSFKVVES